MSSEKEILGLDDQRFAAMIARDLAALDKLTHEQLLYTQAAIDVDINGQPKSLKLLFLNAWARTPQGWKFVAWQSCPQPG